MGVQPHYFDDSKVPNGFQLGAQVVLPVSLFTWWGTFGVQHTLQDPRHTPSLDKHATWRRKSPCMIVECCQVSAGTKVLLLGDQGAWRFKLRLDAAADDATLPTRLPDASFAGSGVMRSGSGTVCPMSVWLEPFE